jgi:hypothetical protein
MIKVLVPVLTMPDRIRQSYHGNRAIRYGYGCHSRQARVRDLQEMIIFERADFAKSFPVLVLRTKRQTPPNRSGSQVPNIKMLCAKEVKRFGPGAVFPAATAGRRALPPRAILFHAHFVSSRGPPPSGPCAHRDGATLQLVTQGERKSDPDPQYHSSAFPADHRSGVSPFFNSFLAWLMYSGSMSNPIKCSTPHSFAASAEWPIPTNGSRTTMSF